MPAVVGILLGGGRSSRMGTDKLTLERQGRSLAGIAVDALLEVAAEVVFASPHRDGVPEGRVRFVLEDPPFGGPAAGIAAAVATLADVAADAEVYLLAGDLADPAAVVALLAAAPLGSDGTVPVDDDGWPQYLAGRYRLGSLRRALRGDVRDASVRRVLSCLDLAHVAAGSLTADIDTPEQARHAGLA